MVRPIAPADLLNLLAAGDATLHPDGELIAYTINWLDEESDANRAQVHLHDGNGNRQLTDGHSDRAPSFSPDGTRLLILRSEPKGKPAPAIVNIESGEVQVIEGFEDGASRVVWAGNDRIVVLAAQRPDDQDGLDSDELARRPRLITGANYRFNGKGWTHDRPGQIFVIDLAEGNSIRRLTDGTTDHQAIAVSPDGATILATVVDDDDADLTGANNVVLGRVDGSGHPTRLSPPGGSWSGQLGWLQDGRPFAVGGLDAGILGFDRIYILDPEGSAAPVRLGDADVNAGSMLGAAVALPVDGGLIGPSVRGGRVTIDHHDLTTNSTTIAVSFDGVITSFDSTSDGSRVVATVTTPTRPAELWEIKNGERTRLVELNTELLSELDLAEVETVSVPSTDGAEVEAYLCRPPASAPDTGSPRPGLVYVHGGPTAAYGLGFFDEFQIAAAAGYVVIGGNPRGSDGYGEAWAQSVVGNLGTIDWEDVQAITDHLAGLDDVDPERIGIGGGSYGGFMSAWAVGSTNRYKAALIERCVINWESFAGTSDIGPYFTPLLLGATVESDTAALRRQSPIHLAANVTTPSLILHSEEDWRCPPEQAEQLFTAYRRHGVDVTFVRFPGENHELSRSGSPRHRVERLGFVHDFYSKHLGGATLP